MGRGFDGIRAAAAELEQRRQSGGGGDFRRWFQLKNSRDNAVVRFLEQGDDIHWCYAVRLPAPPNRSWGDWEPSLDQSDDGSGRCPFVERGMKRSVRGYVNVLWRDAPKVKRDAEGKAQRDGNNNIIFDGVEDQVAIWHVGIQVLQDLETIETTYKGLMSRDFRITRMGVKLDTKYRIDPADPDHGATPMSEADKKLAAEKYDLTPLVTPKSWEEAEAVLTGKPVTGPTGQQQQSAVDPSLADNPFMRARQ